MDFSFKRCFFIDGFNAKAIAVAVLQQNQDREGCQTKRENPTILKH